MSREEEQLRDLWTQILQVEPFELGLDSDFIRQGGDSLAAMRLVAGAEKEGLHLPVATAMAHPRLSDMASHMRPLSSQTQELAPSPFSLLPPHLDPEALRTRCAAMCKVDVDEIEDIYPITALQDMLLLASSRRPGTYVLRLTFQLPPSMPVDTFISAWNKVVQSADILRTRIVSDPDAGQQQAVMKTFDWDFYDTIEEFETQNDHAPMGHNTRLARLTIVRNGDSESPIFIFTAHHVTYDAFMLNMIFERVTQYCQTVGRHHLSLCQFSRHHANITSQGEYIALSPFKKYVAYLNRLPFKPSMEFWKTALKDSPPTAWPPVPRNESLETDIVRHNVPIEVRPTQFTLAVIGQAAFTLLFSAETGSDDTVFGMTFSGRDAALPSILHTAGPTLYTIPFRSRIDRTKILGSFLDSVRQAIIERSKYGHIGMPAIRRASEDAAQACGFRGLFAVQPRRLETPEEVFGKRLSLTEEMGRLGLIFECFITDNTVEVVAEFNCASLERPEMELFVRRFSELMQRLVALPADTLVGDIEIVAADDCV